MPIAVKLRLQRTVSFESFKDLRMVSVGGDLRVEAVSESVGRISAGLVDGDVRCALIGAAAKAHPSFLSSSQSSRRFQLPVVRPRGLA